jgi:hypothetical protein
MIAFDLWIISSGYKPTLAELREPALEVVGAGIGLWLLLRRPRQSQKENDLA